MDFGFFITLFLVALVANGVSALAGGGAGLLQLPALLFLGLPFPVALATHKIATVALGAGATLRHLKSTRFDARLTGLLLLAGLPGVLLGAWVIVITPPQWAIKALGLLTLLLGLYSFFKPELGLQSHPRHRHGFRFWMGAVVVFIGAVLNGSLSSGTGLFVTLWLVYWFGLDYKVAVAYTLLLVGLFWNATGAAALALLSEVQWSWLPALLLGSFVGGYIGAHWSIVKGNRWIKWVFESITIVVGLKLLLM